MILSEKYRITERDERNIILEKKSEVRDKESGELKQKWVLQGYYSPSAHGRATLYQRMINLEIADSEEQDLQNILDIVKDTSDSVIEFFKSQEKVCDTTR